MIFANDSLFVYIWTNLKAFRMKKLVYFLVITPLLFSCGGDPDDETQEETTETITTDEVVEVEVAPENSFLIEPNNVGIFKIGEAVPSMLPAELSTRQFNEDQINEEGEMVEHAHNVIFNQLEDVVELIMDQGDAEHHEDKHIGEMMVLSDYYQTSEGMGVGSTMEDFQVTYPDATIWYASASNSYMLETETVLGAQFIMNNDDCIKLVKTSQDLKKINFGHFKEGARIVKVRIY